MGPTAAHSGSGAVWQKDVKSPKGILSVWRLIGRPGGGLIAVVLDARCSKSARFEGSVGSGSGGPSRVQESGREPSDRRNSPMVQPRSGSILSLQRDFPQRSVPVPFRKLVRAVSVTRRLRATRSGSKSSIILPGLCVSSWASSIVECESWRPEVGMIRARGIRGWRQEGAEADAGAGSGARFQMRDTRLD